MCRKLNERRNVSGGLRCRKHSIPEHFVFVTNRKFVRTSQKLVRLTAVGNNIMLELRTHVVVICLRQKPTKNFSMSPLPKIIPSRITAQRRERGYPSLALFKNVLK